MVTAVQKYWAYDKNGKPIKCFLYLLEGNDTLPADAPVGSRAILSDGRAAMKTPSGWKIKGEDADERT